MQICKYIESPLGKLMLVSENNMLTGILYDNQNYSYYFKNMAYEFKDISFFNDVEKWLNIYFSGSNPNFIIPTFFYGTDFQKRVWDILKTIPYGKSITYGNIAKIICSKYSIKTISSQAVGQAVGKNPISIIIPCHRVLSLNNKITGYNGGIHRKKLLLEIENIYYK